MKKKEMKRLEWLIKKWEIGRYAKRVGRASARPVLLLYYVTYYVDNKNDHSEMLTFTNFRT